MLEMYRRVFDTLNRSVDREIKGSIFQSEVYKNNKWSVLERWIVLWSSHFKKYTCLMFFLSILIFVNLILWQPWIKANVLEYTKQWKEMIGWQDTFLAGQLTIVGVVYPLVVGLVSVYLQNRSAKSVILPIYHNYSGFMFAGMSGLSLAAFILAGYFMRASLSDKYYVAICMVSAVWLFLMFV
ncbi:hypothetical protein P3339_08040 [Microbulbifer sp. MLAF003]|uniref:hypothetical protein n=1 Tax=Microbulbifer sp. MLAF003 TaxID=3032582 RepID=UPI0024AD7629|nr:hypothetical protein [Microbulbifer sp. MLAF003]WHI52698.1 hypothetical protein P3339_08040 [Microbulbifer sp. MLAF003]